MNRQEQKNSVTNNSVPKYKYISTVAIVRTIPRNECSIFHEHKIREEVVVQATLQVGDTWLNYMVRFVHKRTIKQARSLRPGMKLYLEEGRFAERLGRCESEFWVKRFSIAPTPL